MPLKKLFNSASKSSALSRKDFTFGEWETLSPKAKSDICNTWSPYHPEIGELTRNAIINEFKRLYPELAKQSLEIGYAYFGWMVGCIYIIVPNSSIKVPKEFASLFVNKGYIYKRINKETILVNWRYGGTKAEFKLFKK